MRVAVIINPISGGATPSRARERAELASSLLASCGKPGDIFITERKGHARELAAAAVAGGAPLVVAWGGDGTVNEVASVLAFGSTPLAIVPSGSGNGLALDLGIPRRPQLALTRALAASPRRIDAGELDRRLFFNIAGVGFDAHVASCFDREAGRRGFASYLRITLRELRAYRCATYRISTTGASSRTALLVTLANGSQFGNGMRIAPGARLDDGKLELVVFEESSRLRTLSALPRLFANRAIGTRGLSIESIEQTTIEAERPMLFHVDGEPVQGGTRLEARVLTGVLNVCV
jgi:diacylglycerol kinase family enzyme